MIRQAHQCRLAPPGIRTENLPPPEHVKNVERRLAAEDKKALKKPDALD